MKSHFDNAGFVYIGTKPCGCTVSACVDSPDHVKDTAKFVSDCIKDGLTVDRVPLGDAQTKLKQCKCNNKEKEMPLFKRKED